MPKRVALILLSLVWMAPAAWAVDRYVAPGGTDIGDCTLGNDCATLPYAIGRMIDGDTLFVADGTYSAGFDTGLGGCALIGSAHIALDAADACPVLGCTIQAINVTDPPSVTLTGSQMAVYAVAADHWRIQGIEFDTELGIYACGADDLTLADAIVRVAVQDNGTGKNFFEGLSGLTLSRVRVFLDGLPCDANVQNFYGVRLSDSTDVVIEDSYLGFVNQLMAIDAVDGLIIRRSRFQHWVNHGLTMTDGSRNILIENNVFGGSTATGCSTAPMNGPRAIDVYEVRDLTVRNNTFVGHGYSPRSMAISYFQFGNTNAGCALGPAEPGFCEFDTAVVCTANDIAAIPGEPNSATSSECPQRADGLPWSPNQRCSGVCELENVKFYNNLVYDLRDTGVPEAGTRYVDWLGQGHWVTTTNLEFDGNYYSGGVERWICGGGGGDKLSLAAWRGAQCLGGPNPDPRAVVGKCSVTTTLSCGTSMDCPAGEACQPTAPAFVDYAAEDYRAAAGATQIDAGLSGPDVDGLARCASEDFAGNPRCDGACDIGAFEVPVLDSDGDGVACDNCPGDPNPLQEDLDGDGIGDVCDPCPADPLNDIDADGVCGDVDNCPFTPNGGQADDDLDDIGDLCDDGDGDGILDIYETGTGVYVSETDTGTDPNSADSDGDGYGDGDELDRGFDPNDATSAPGGVPFDAPVTAAAATDAADVTSADLDGDGSPDLLWAGDATIAWQANDGSGAFGIPLVLTAAATGASSVTAVDVDGDGDLDVVWSAAGASTVAWHANTDGAGTFGPSQAIDAATAGAAAQAAGDLDGDGDADVVVVDADSLTWYANTAGTFAAAPAISGSVVDGRDVTLLDVDRDGDLDVIAASATEIAWYENTAGDGSAWTPHSIVGAAAGVTAIAATDVDGDGDGDVVATSSGDTTLAWYPNTDGAGSFGPAVILTTTLVGAATVTAADVDRDGDVDFVAGGSSETGWYENTLGAGTAWGLRQIAMTAATSVATGDLDGDGDHDVIRASADSDDVAVFPNLTIHSNAAFPLATSIDGAAAGARGVATGDLDRDGDPDVVSAAALADAILWHENLGGDGATWQTWVLTEAADFAASVAVADLDGDGDADVVFAAAFDDTVGWLENTAGDGSAWATHAVDAATGLPLAVHAADVDRDGDVDVLAASFTDDTLTWYENVAGDGLSWTPHTVSAIAAGAQSIQAADVDGDGDPDVLGASALDDTVAWHENTAGDGTAWTRRVVSAAATLAGAVVAADVDGDGDTDVVAASAGDDTIAWHENTAGDGTAWTPRVIDNASVFARAVLAADLDGDGDVDVAAASAGDDSVAWFENTAGDGSAWVRHLITDQALLAAAVGAADLAGDGRVDVVSASSQDDTVAWYPNLGGAFELKTTDLAPLSIGDGGSAALLAIDLIHHGRPGDSAVELSRLELLLEAAPGLPLTAAETTALIANLSVHRDDGSGAFEPAADPAAFTLPAPAPAAGLLAIDLAPGNPDLQVAAASSVRYFVVVELTATASTANPNRLRVTHLTSSSSVVLDAAAGLRLTGAWSVDVASGTVAALADTDGDGVPDDGNDSGAGGDAPCTGPGVTGCDDNCPQDVNDQTDTDGDGAGDACDLCPADPFKRSPGVCGCGLTELSCLTYAEDFEAVVPGANPPGWVKTGPNYDLTPLPDSDPSFLVQDLAGNRVYATDSTDDHIHSHYDMQTFDAYELTGRFRLTDALGDVGVTFHSQYTGVDAYYRLRRFTASATFQFVNRGTDFNLFGDRDTEVNPVPGVWYRFRIRVEDDGSRTDVYATVWEDGTLEPGTFQAHAWNPAAGRPLAGRIGIWSAGEGSKYWDDLLVTPLAALDLCPDDPVKTDPGVCGCGAVDDDTDEDGTADCIDACPFDERKTAPGVCGCDFADTDTDADGTPDCNDACPADAAKLEPGICGCGAADVLDDGDGDNTLDCLDACPLTPDDQSDGDGDGFGDACDACPADPAKQSPGPCGCGTAEIDNDGDGTPDCNDLCPADPAKTDPGGCGCGLPDVDGDGDGFLDCLDNCPLTPNDQADGDGDGFGDACDLCPADPDKGDPGVCGCGTADTDGDGDGTPDCNDLCPADPAKTDPGACGCGAIDIDGDGDGAADCIDNCLVDPNDQSDGDGDGVGDACDPCAADPAKVVPGVCGCGVDEAGCAWSYAENFQAYALGDNPADWVDTGPNNSLVPLALPDNRFLVDNVGGAAVYGTDSTETNIHSHYQGALAGSFSTYEFSGRMRISADRGGIGVTFGSDYNASDTYYRLRRFDDTSFALSPHGSTIALAGDIESGVVPVADTWYHFRIRVSDSPAETRIRANVWAEGAGEPAGWQIDASDANPLRPRAGTIGVWSFLTGSKYWDDLTLAAYDDCPADPGKVEPGICGCGVADVDLDGDAVIDCLDDCVDGDGDGYGADGGAGSCLGPDCDDGDPAVHPGVAEVACDGIDNDCDGGTPDAQDLDGDGFACDVDCDEGDPGVNPGAAEVGCDGLDNDCDAGTPDVHDADGDGFACDVDCDDANPGAFPGAIEFGCDGVDNDCDAGTPDVLDADSDGAACDVDCDDDDPGVHPGAAETGCDGIDNDCDAGTPDVLDGDADTFACDVDCDDDDPDVNPGAAEVTCDGLDNDCDPATDDSCDDGLFCNGAETCSGMACLPGGDPCAGAIGCDEATDTCITEPIARLSTHVVAASASFQTVALPEGYQAPVVVCSAQYAANGVPVVVRVSNVGPAGFDVRLQNPSGDPIVGDAVHCLAVETGVWEVEGLEIEAFTYSSTVTAENNGWVGQLQAYGRAYTNPVVLGQVMTENDPGWSVFWSHGTTRSNPPSPAALTTGKHVGSDPDITRLAETVGVVVLEAGHGTLGAIEYEAGLGPDIVAGATNAPPYVYSFGTAFGQVPTVAVVSQAAMDGADGSWAQTHGASPLTTTTLAVSVDEDQLADVERSHTTEQVAYAVFAGELVYPAAPSCTMDGDCDDGLYCNGAETCNAGSCQAGTPPVCDDGVGCTVDSCNEATDSCDSAPSDGLCDNGLYCDGSETCDAALDCQAGTPPACDDGVACTVDSCNEATDSCSFSPSDALCDNGLYCDGAEACDAVLGCQAAADPCAPLGCDEGLDQCVCQSDGDCDDGLFCNGQETCDGVSCQPGTDPCVGQPGCDEAADQCLTGPVARMETHVVNVGSTFQTVLLAQTYVSPVVVCSVQYSANSLPVVTRVSNVTATSFDVRLQNPSGNGILTDPAHCLVVEEGVWGVDALKVEAFTYSSTVTDENNGWVGQVQAYGQAYANPVVLGQVMTENDPGWSVFWSRGTTRSNPPSSGSLITGKHVGSDPDTTRAVETVGVVVLEAGHGTLGGIDYEAGLGADIVAGVTNTPPYVYSFATAFGQVPTVAVVSQAAMDGSDGSWAQVHGAAPLTMTTLAVSVDEDQLADAERNHTTEQVAYAVFAGDLVYPAAPSCTVDGDCDDGLYCNGAETCNAGSCQAGPPPVCDDGVSCTVDSCNETTDSCDSAPSDGLCDNGLYCDGAETCDAVLDCQAGTPPVCDDGVGCTVDSCNESTDSCSFSPSDASCDNGLYCDGAETCDAVLDCQAAADPCAPLGCDEGLDQCVCQSNGDCDDGLFCNGQETCDGVSCQPGADPCVGQPGCDEATDQCLTGPVAQLETHVVNVGSTFQTVVLNATYVNPVVVCSVQYAANSLPVVTRVRNVGPTAFEVRLQNPSGNAAVVDDVHCLVVEEGVWDVDGVKLEAFTTSSTITDENNSWVGEAQGFGQAYTNPVVLGQVMTENDPDWSVFWSYSTFRSTPPIYPDLVTGKHVCADPDVTRAPESLGVIVFEAAHGTLGGIEYEAALGPDTVAGHDDSPPYLYSFTTPFAESPAFALVTQSAMDGTDGSWAQLHGASPLTTTTLALSVDEALIGDPERNHTTEQVAYVVFADDLDYPPVQSCSVDGDCDDGLYCNGAETCNAGSCQAGTPPVCDDGVGCTVDSCNEATDSCDSAPSDGLCDNGLFCDGAETCDAALDCQAGTPPVCDDGVGCTVDSCNEAADSCSFSPVDALCDNGLFCDGAEICDAALGCQAAADPCAPLGCDEGLDQCVCQSDGDCDDGSFCNGQETCDGVSCQPGADPCSGQPGCDEAADQCLTGPVARLETHTVTVGSGFQTVPLTQTFVSPVVVCSARYSANSLPVVTRVANVTATSFDVRLQNPSGNAIVADPVHCLVVEEGVWDVDGLKVEAFTYNSTVTDTKPSWIGEAQSYGQAYSDPVVLGQVMTQNDPDWSAFWASATNRGSPPTPTQLRTGKHVGSDPDTTRAAETLGMIVLEAGHGIFVGVEYEAGVGPDNVAGVVNSPPYVYAFGTAFATPPTTAVVTQAAMDGADGSWGLLFGADPFSTTGLDIAVDEDQLADAERSHTTEQMAFVAFAGDLRYPDAEAPTSPPGLAVETFSSSRNDLSWFPATDNAGVTGYGVYRESVRVATLPVTPRSYSDTGLAPSSAHAYQVTALDAAGNESTPSPVVVGTTNPLDGVAPTMPGALVATPFSAFRIDLDWDPSTDNVAVTSYRIRRDGVEVGSVEGFFTSFSDTGLAPGITYDYEVSAEDGDGNVSSWTPVTMATTNPDPDATVFDIWYGDSQQFGDPGRAQQWLNVLGNVSDPDGIASLTYSLDGGAFQALSVGSDLRRNYFDGDFVVEIDFAALSVGPHSITLRAQDTLGNTLDRVVDFTLASGVWPANVSVDWSTVSDLQDVTQVVDGPWALDPDGVRTVKPAYDRLLAFGDTTWVNYEATVHFVVHSYDEAGFTGFSGRPAFGLLVRWNGHTDTPVVCPQPHCGWLPHGNSVWYRWNDDGGEPGSIGGTLVDPAGRFLDFGVPYVLKVQVESQPGVGEQYRFKVWRIDEAEPAGWTDTGFGDPSVTHGSLLVIAHHVDAIVGDVEIVPLP